MKKRNIISTKEAFYLLMEGKNQPVRKSYLVNEIARMTNQTVDAVEFTTFKSTKWFCEDWFLKDFETTKPEKNRYFLEKRKYKA